LGKIALHRVPSAPFPLQRHNPTSLSLFTLFFEGFNPEDELHRSISGCCSPILEVVLALATCASTLLSVLLDLKTPLTAFNSAEDEYMFQPLVEASLMTV